MIFSGSLGTEILQQLVPPKYQYFLTRLSVVISQKAVILIISSLSVVSVVV